MQSIIRNTPAVEKVSRSPAFRGVLVVREPSPVRGPKCSFTMVPMSDAITPKKRRIATLNRISNSEPLALGMN